MKELKFKHLPYQAAAVESVIDCFAGQPRQSNTAYRIDPGRRTGSEQQLDIDEGFRNADLLLTETEILRHIRSVQQRQNLPQSDSLVRTPSAAVNLDIEMETGTGKTYCYIKTMFELHKLYGWSKFIVVVPSIAIREGVYSAFQLTTEHFLEEYGKRAKVFIYNSKSLHEIENYSSDAGINVMIINAQAFAARGKDARRIYEELDDFQSRRPIDVIRKNRPILIIDEPQKMEGNVTREKLAEFGALFALRYSATHKTTHNKIHRLDALDAYNQKLVKKIAVRGVTIKGLPGTDAYLYLQSIEVSASKPPVARMEYEIKQQGGIRRIVRKLELRDNLHDLSNGMEQYKGFVVSDIDATKDIVAFTNGVELSVGDAVNDMNEATLRRIQIREAIKAHFDREKTLFHQGMKVLSLFFIGEVDKYRDYKNEEDTRGEYAKIFEEEYKEYLNEVLTLELEGTAYGDYLKNIPVEKTHNGYFAVDKNRKLVNPNENKDGESDDVSAYDLILKDKKRLLSLEEPVRFIFSHSALREGWDNPNVFTICALKHSDNTVTRRQEVGRGLRIAVNNQGDRMDDPLTVHQVNVLTVVASESYKDFVTALQSDIRAELSARPKKANENYFKGKILQTPDGDIQVTEQMARQVYRYLLKNDYADDNDQITQAYHDDKENGALTPLPEELQQYDEQIHLLISSVFSDALLPDIDDGRRTKENPLNDNFYKKEFRALWEKINHKAVYAVDFDSDELVDKCVKSVNKKDKMKITKLQYVIEAGEQTEIATAEDLERGEAFIAGPSRTQTEKHAAHSSVKYDLIGQVAENTELTRRTIANILKQTNEAVLSLYPQNPEDFIAQFSNLIKEQKAATVVEHLAYDPMNEKYDTDIFTTSSEKKDFSTAFKANKHVYDYVFTDSKTERKFVEKLDTSSEVVVYAKLPRGFSIPTPVGSYNPDWAISFKEGTVKHIYFVAETKGSMNSLQLKKIEEKKIDCARKFFEKLATDNIKYDVVDSYSQLMQVVQ